MIKQTSYYEAGHAIIARLVGLTFYSVSIVPGDGLLSRVSFSGRMFESLSNIAVIMVLTAGEPATEVAQEQIGDCLFALRKTNGSWHGHKSYQGRDHSLRQIETFTTAYEAAAARHNNNYADLEIVPMLPRATIPFQLSQEKKQLKHAIESLELTNKNLNCEPAQFKAVEALTNQYPACLRG
ncbi:MAG: hypothetical protein IH984_09535 [Planctomycetes bacterium]|nr:hypothetical protein [Planctomycetota bacterium]